MEGSARLNQTGWRSVLPLAAAILIFVGLATSLAMTKAPWCDEGWFGNPSYNLAFHGKMSTNVLNPSGHFLNAYLSGIKERTYVVPPNHLVALAGWYRLFGFSLLTMRMYSIFWGALMLPAFFFILYKLLPDARVAQVATLFTALDFIYLWSCADGRMDATANALAIGSIAAYLYLRETGLTRAVLVSQWLSAAAVFTHPNAVLMQLVLLVLVWRFDRAKLRPDHILMAAAPYLFFGLLWSLYIAQSPQDFYAQFFANAAGRDSSRWNVILQPWIGVWGEFLRHVSTYVISNLWSGSINRSFLLIPFFYAASLFEFFRKRKAYSDAVMTFLLCTLTLLLAMTFLNGFKAPMYLIYLLPFYHGVLAFELLTLWKRGINGKLVAAAIGGAFLVLQIIPTVEHVRADEYHRYYEPAIAQLKQEQAAGKTIVGTAALGFGLGFQGFEDDWRLGKYSHLEPDFLVLDRSYRSFSKCFEEKEPLVFSHILTTLTTRYRFHYRFGTYWIFERVKTPSAYRLLNIDKITALEKGKQANSLFEQLEQFASNAGIDTLKETPIDAQLRF
jgi:riboflavin transporter FmnP